MTSNRTLVSVIIPCFNYGRFLGDAIESVLNQTYEPIEIVVVDDGSTDDSASVAQQYPVKLISLPHAGVSVAVNTGVATARGDFIMRLDADDVLACTYVEEMLAALHEHSRAAFAYSDGEYSGSVRGPFRLQPFDAEALAEGAYAVSLALTRRAAFESVGGYDAEMGALRCEDWDLWLTFAERGEYGVHVPKSLWSYRRHARGSRNTWNLSPNGIRREWKLIANLQDRHQSTFCVRSLLRRLESLPGRVFRGDKSPRQAALLTLFYGVMLIRLALGLTARRSAGGIVGKDLPSA